MIEVTVHNDAGRILRTLTVPDLGALADNLRPGDRYVLGAHPIGQGYIEDDAFHPFPEKPGTWAVWDYAAKAWLDPRIPADPVAELAALRAATWLTKAEFVEACMSVNLLTPDEAIIAANDIPPSFDPIIAMLPAFDQTRARIQWRAVTRIERMNPLILRVAAEAAISDETLDALFGLTEYSPL